MDIGKALGSRLHDALWNLFQCSEMSEGAVISLQSLYAADKLCPHE